MFIVLFCAVVACVHGANRLCRGDITRLRSTGQLKGGVAASNADAKHDLPYLKARKACYDASADKNCIQASLIAAIASRESRGGSLLQRTGGFGDFGHAWGIMQCDLKHSGLNCKACGWNTCCHIEMMVRQLLVPYINQVKKKHPSWPQQNALKGGVAAYNSGVSTIRTWPGVDSSTTGKDYSSDVISRALWLHSQGWN